MTRRPNERDIVRAEELARRSAEPASQTRSVRAELSEKLRRMAERADAHREQLRAQGVEPPLPPSSGDTRAWLDEWETREVERVREAQRRMIGRATGEFGYVSTLPEHVAATHAHDLREVEGAKLMVGVIRKARRILDERGDRGD